MYIRPLHCAPEDSEALDLCLERNYSSMLQMTLTNKSICTR